MDHLYYFLVGVKLTGECNIDRFNSEEEAIAQYPIIYENEKEWAHTSICPSDDINWDLKFRNGLESNIASKNGLEKRSKNLSIKR